MKGDFSRNTFRSNRHYSRVLMQQGRVLLDSDWNEQGSIFLYHLQSLARDLIGAYGGPATNCGFRVIVNAPDPDLPSNFPADAFDHNFVIGAGRYYVDGILCENEGFKTYAQGKAPEIEGMNQFDHLAEPLADGNYLIYLDVWERHVTALDDELIREVALGPQGPDTTTRARIVWQVKALKLEGNAFNNFECANTLPQPGPPPQPIHPAWAEQLRKWQPNVRGILRAKADEPDDLAISDPCIISPEARYRGAENQLYRVEIHQGGTAATGATFKWSRENGSVVFPVRRVSGQKVTLAHLGRDAHLSLEVGDWVEIESFFFDRKDLAQPAPLLQVEEVNYQDLTVTLNTEVTTGAEGARILRRWDQKRGDPRVGGLELRDGAAIIKEDLVGANENWLNLEDGIKIQFQRTAQPMTYRAGDYWLIPARTATGDVEWPGPVGKPAGVPPHGVVHHYAPLARIQVAPGAVTLTRDLRRKFPNLGACLP